MDEINDLVTRLQAIQAELAHSRNLAIKHRVLLAEAALNQATNLTRHAIDILKTHARKT